MTFELVAFPIVAFVFGALCSYYTGSTKWRNRYYEGSKGDE